MYVALELTNVDDNVQTVPARGHHEDDGRGEPQQDARAVGEVKGLQVQSRLKVRDIYFTFIVYTARDIIIMFVPGHCCVDPGVRGGQQVVMLGRGSRPWPSWPPPSTSPPNSSPPRRRSKVNIV